MRAGPPGGVLRLSPGGSGAEGLRTDNRQAKSIPRGCESLCVPRPGHWEPRSPGPAHTQTCHLPHIPAAHRNALWSLEPTTQPRAPPHSLSPLLRMIFSPLPPHLENSYTPFQAQFRHLLQESYDPTTLGACQGCRCQKRQN